MTHYGEHLWSICAYFNPSGYRRRYHNYRLFRNQLTTNLVTVEMAIDGQVFELADEDADILIRVTGHDVLWQKERLLNIALKHLPKDVKYVAWLDCDLIFQSGEWAEDAARRLEDVPIVQAFSKLYDLDKDVLPGDVSDESITSASPSVAYKVANGTSNLEDFRPTTAARRGLGFAWAARRDLLDRHGLYDAFILGSGDRAIACAAWGRFRDAVYQVRLNSRQEDHYLSWALPFYESVGGRVGYVPGAVYHLWHGDPMNRSYQSRHVEFSQLQFDPFVDLVLNCQGCWELASHRRDVHRFAEEYFASRKEDGEGDSQ